MCRSRWHRNVRGAHERGPCISTARAALASIATLASLVSLVAAGCSGEHAYSPRDASGLAGAGGKGGAGTAGTSGIGGTSGSAGTGGGVGLSTGTAGTGGDGTGGDGAGGTGGIRPTGDGIDGSTCSAGSDCMSSWCVDSVCCQNACAGDCVTCKGAIPGVCAPAAADTDPRNMCAVQSASSCGTTGLCDGAGACRYHPAGQVCDATPSCDGASVVTMRACNGSGMCLPSMSQGCSPYGCASAACRTSCSADTDCAPNAFCSAKVCLPNGSVNLAGNGDLETGTTTGWAPAFGSGTIGLSAVASGGVSNSGGYSVVGTNRSFAYQGPSYALPTGVGKYVISAWGLQRDMASINGHLQVRLTCKDNTNYVDVAFDVPMVQNVWTSFSSTIDTTKYSVDCLPTGATPGLVRSASLYINHAMDVPTPFPNLYLDDVVVQVTDGHNLVGNANFESGLVDGGWSLSAGSSTVTIDSTVAHGGTKCMHQTGRSIPAAGPRWVLPTGAARYAISFWVRHTPDPQGGDPDATYDLSLQPTYNCINPSGTVTPPAIATAMAVPKNTWVELKGTATFPPADAPLGCKLALAAVFVRQEGTSCSGKCPELFIDDVSITLAP